MPEAWNTGYMLCPSLGEMDNQMELDALGTLERIDISYRSACIGAYPSLGRERQTLMLALIWNTFLGLFLDDPLKRKGYHFYFRFFFYNIPFYPVFFLTLCPADVAAFPVLFLNIFYELR